MLEGVDEIELEAYLDQHPRIIPLFEIDVIETTTDYATPTTLHKEAYEPVLESIMELRRAWEAFEKEMEISERVTTLRLEEINIRTTSDPRILFIAKELRSE